MGRLKTLRQNTSNFIIQNLNMRNMKSLLVPIGIVFAEESDRKFPKLMSLLWYFAFHMQCFP